MTLEEARQRIQSSIEQFGPHAAPALDLVISEVRSSLGNPAANELIDELDLELEYGIPPTDPQSGD